MGKAARSKSPKSVKSKGDSDVESRDRSTSPIVPRSKSQAGRPYKSVIDSDSEADKKHSDEESLSSRTSGNYYSEV